MSNIFHVSSSPGGNARFSNRIAARCAKLDVIAAAMLTGGASGGWGMARALRSRTARCADGRVRAERAAPLREQSPGERGGQLQK
jgi:hypothetical protein